MYLVSLWASYITSPGVHEKMLWQSSRPSRWHPQHMWHDLLQHGYTGGTESLCKQQAGSSDVGGPTGTRQQNEMPITLCGSADAPRHCQAFSFIRPRSDAYRGVQPEAITAAALQCRHTHIHTYTDIYTDKVTFGSSFLKGGTFIRGTMWCRGIAFFSCFFSDLCFEYVQGRGDKTLMTWRSQWMCMNT